MPNKASEVEQSGFLRLLVLGGPKCGKTHTVIATCAKPAYVINSDDKHSLRPAARVTSEFEWDLALGNDLAEIEKCIREARLGVKEGRYKTIVWDTVTEYCRRVEEVYAAATMNSAGEADGRRFWPMHRKHIVNIIDRLFMLKAHVIVNAHYDDAPGGLIEGQVKKSGEGVVPRLGGQLRSIVPAMFQDVVFLEKKGGKRSFITSNSGVFGPGCRSLPGVETCDADIGALWELMNPSAGGKKKVNK